MKQLLANYRGMGLGILLSSFSTLGWAADVKPTLEMQAVISKKGLGCEMTLPQTVLQFKPLQANNIATSVQTYEIKPLVVQLACINETQALKPRLTLQGITPYSSDSYQTVFLNGTPNGLGFMVRQSRDDKPIDVADFYRPDIAIGNNNQGILLRELNNDNKYQTESTLWVGVVGPFQSNIIAGKFHASLIINMAFE